MNRKIVIGLVATVAVLVVAGGATLFAIFSSSGTAAEHQISDSTTTDNRATGSTATAASIGGAFTLVGADGKTVTDKSYGGKWLLVYFGYTFCPDVCPTTLNNIAQALAALGPRADKIAPLFITIDPKRDTPQVIGAYVKSFDTRIIGLSGSPAQIAAVAKEYHVYYAPQPGDGDDYLVDHSSFIYLMTPQGAFAKVLPGSTTGSAMADAVRPFIG